MKIIDNRSIMYRCLATINFFLSGAGSIYLFYQVPGLPFLQGIDEEAFRTAVSLAWVMIFPVWMALYFVAMALLETVLRTLASRKPPHITTLISFLLRPKGK